jgi:anti-sigma factor RsiW
VFGKGGIMTCNEAVALSTLYLNGELDSASCVEFDAHLHACPSCARELREQQELDARLRTAILDEPLDTRELDQRIRRHVMAGTPWPWISAAAGVAAALMVAWIVFARSTPHVYAEAAEDHRREVVEREARHWTLENTAMDAMAQGQGVSPAGIHAPETAGYRLQRARLCRLNGSVYLHLVYSDGAREFSLFLRHRDREPALEPSNAGHHGAEHLAAFRTSALTAVVVSDQSGEDALRLAGIAARAL